MAAKKKRQKRKDPLDQLVEAAGPEILGRFVKRLAVAWPEIRPECFEFFKKHVILTPYDEAVSGAEAMFAFQMENATINRRFLINGVAV